MSYLLDTNICIHYFKGQFGLIEKIRKVGYSECAISEITLAELFGSSPKAVGSIQESLIIFVHH